MKYTFLYLFFLCLFYSCAKKAGSEWSNKGLITASFTMTPDTFHLDLEEEEAAFRISGVDSQKLILDFGGSFLIGANWGLAPDQQKGIALEIKEATYVEIKNATFLGFNIGIVTEAVDTLILKNCHFDHFYRAAENLENTSNRKASYGLLGHTEDYIKIENSSFKRMDLAVFVNQARQMEIKYTDFHFLNASALLMATYIEDLKIDKSSFLYIGTALAKGSSIEGNADTLEISNSYWAHNKQSAFPPLLAPDATNIIAYQEQVDSSLWNKRGIDSLLARQGISFTTNKLFDQWGIYDFSYPKIWFRESSSDRDIYLLTAPIGNWRLVDGKGYTQVIPKTGTFPATLQAVRDSNQEKKQLSFEYLGKSSFLYGKPQSKKGAIMFDTHGGDNK